MSACLKVRLLGALTLAWPVFAIGQDSGLPPEIETDRYFSEAMLRLGERAYLEADAAMGRVLELVQTHEGVRSAA